MISQIPASATGETYIMLLATRQMSREVNQAGDPKNHMGDHLASFKWTDLSLFQNFKQHAGHSFENDLIVSPDRQTVYAVSKGDAFPRALKISEVNEVGLFLFSEGIEDFFQRCICFCFFGGCVFCFFEGSCSNYCCSSLSSSLTSHNQNQNFFNLIQKTLSTRTPALPSLSTNIEDLMEKTDVIPNWVIMLSFNSLNRGRYLFFSQENSIMILSLWKWLATKILLLRNQLLLTLVT